MHQVDLMLMSFHEANVQDGTSRILKGATCVWQV